MGKGISGVGVGVCTGFEGSGTHNRWTWGSWYNVHYVVSTYYPLWTMWHVHWRARLSSLLSLSTFSPIRESFLCSWLPCCWQQCGPWFLCEKRRGARVLYCSPRHCSIVRCCCPLWVAMSPTAMWLLFLVWKRSRAGGGGGLWCSPQPFPLFIYITCCCCCWSIVSCRVAIFDVAPAFWVRKWEGRGCCSPKIMGTVMTTGVVTVWMTWHVCWHARSSPWAVMLLPAGDVAMPCCC